MIINMTLTRFNKVIHSQGNWVIFRNDGQTELMLTYKAQPFMRSRLDRLDDIHMFQTCQGQPSNKDLNDLIEIIPVVVGLVRRHKTYSERLGKVIDTPTL